MVKKCETCEFFAFNGHCCDYAERVGISRTKLHLGENVDINNPCREYKPRKRRKSKNENR